MRRTVIAGNWKMNMTPAETKKFIIELAPMVKGRDKCDIVLCVPYVDIATAVEAAKGTNIHIGAENVHFAESGAYTGEISAKMLCEIGTEYVVIGHSERRQYFGETDATVNLRNRANEALDYVKKFEELDLPQKMVYNKSIQTYRRRIPCGSVRFISISIPPKRFPASANALIKLSFRMP